MLSVQETNTDIQRDLYNLSESQYVDLVEYTQNGTNYMNSVSLLVTTRIKHFINDGNITKNRQRQIKKERQTNITLFLLFFFCVGFFSLKTGIPIPVTYDRDSVTLINFHLFAGLFDVVDKKHSMNKLLRMVQDDDDYKLWCCCFFKYSTGNTISQNMFDALVIAHSTCSDAIRNYFEKDEQMDNAACDIFVDYLILQRNLCINTDIDSFLSYINQITWNIAQGKQYSHVITHIIYVRISIFFFFLLLFVFRC